ncbi:MAG TPA: hypothetical protein VGL61_06570 [Kofleriaceae bacterium]|jgi:hypothetical protein
MPDDTDKKTWTLISLWTTKAPRNRVTAELAVGDARIDRHEHVDELRSLGLDARGIVERACGRDGRITATIDVRTDGVVRIAFDATTHAGHAIAEAARCVSTVFDTLGDINMDKHEHPLDAAADIVERDGAHAAVVEVTGGDALITVAPHFDAFVEVL